MTAQIDVKVQYDGGATDTVEFSTPTYPDDPSWVELTLGYDDWHALGQPSMLKLTIRPA